MRLLATLVVAIARAIDDHRRGLPLPMRPTHRPDPTGLDADA